MDVRYDGQNAFTAAANGDFPLVVLIWGMALAAQPGPVDMLAATDADGNGIMHHASSTALEGNTSIVHFLMQQVQAAGRSIASVVDARNAAGETPLIRAAHAGNLRVVDTLIKFGNADIRAEDKDSNTALHHAAAEGHLWVLHYLLEVEGTSNPSDSMRNRALYLACEGEHKVVVQYLVSRGVDAQSTEYKGASALDFARTRHLQWLVKLLEANTRSFAVPPTKCRETRLWLVLIYGLLLFAVLSSSYYLPWWAAVPVIVVMLWKSLSKFRAPGGHGHSHGVAKDVEAIHPSKREMKVPPSVALSTKERPHIHHVTPTLAHTLFRPQPELIVGVWAGWVFTFIFFHVVVWVDTDYAFVVPEAKPLLIALVAVEVIFLYVWVRLAVICPADPGVITTFESDVAKMLADAAQGIPPAQASYCRTCFIQKPLRSKHCAQCGVCVARMDHHCGWINRCVGYGNHRLFMLFLLVHILVISGYVALVLFIFQRLLKPGNLAASRGSSALRTWMQVPQLVSNHLLAVLVVFWGVAAVVALCSMVAQHVENITKNLTINEQINWKRYPYLKQVPVAPGTKPPTKLTLENTFDRGVGTNTAEFWRRSGPSALDYRTVFHVSSVDGPAQPLNSQELI